jgi:predicted membrane protein
MIEPDNDRALRLTPQLLMGLIIIAVGALFTLDNLGLVDARHYLRYWPAALILVGTLKVWQSRGGGGTFGGLMFIVAGVWLLLETFRIVTISFADLWPLILVFFGASLVWRGLRGGRERASTDGHSTVSALAVLGGVHRGNNSRAFRGGDLTAVMGGCEIDLRQAAIDGEAVIDVFAMWGGIEIKVPEDWTVASRVVPILGGFEDKTRPQRGAATHRLLIRGFAIMGGIEVKN